MFFFLSYSVSYFSFFSDLCVHIACPVLSFSCFPSLYNHSHLSSNTADWPWELAARERERDKSVIGERERWTGGWFFVCCSFSIVIVLLEKKNNILKINREKNHLSFVNDASLLRGMKTIRVYFVHI